MTEGPDLLKFFAAFVFVLSLMFLLQWALRRAGLAGASLLPNGKRRLKIVETLPLDARRKLMIIRRDDREHVLVLGPAGETLVESLPAAPEVAATVIELPQKDQKNG